MNEFMELLKAAADQLGVLVPQAWDILLSGTIWAGKLRLGLSLSAIVLVIAISTAVGFFVHRKSGPYDRESNTVIATLVAVSASALVLTIVVAELYVGLLKIYAPEYWIIKGIIG